MVTQVRKFEQDAIVESIYDKTVAQLESKAEEVLGGHKDYKEILSEDNSIASICNEIDLLEQKRNRTRRSLKNKVEEFNDALTDKRFKLSFDSWNKPSVSFEITKQYNLRHEIANRVAIALIPKDAIKNLDDIINRIASEIVE